MQENNTLDYTPPSLNGEVSDINNELNPMEFGKMNFAGGAGLVLGMGAALGACVVVAKGIDFCATKINSRSESTTVKVAEDTSAE